MAQKHSTVRHADRSRPSIERMPGLGFDSTAQSFEAQASSLARGFKTSQFVQWFKAGLLVHAGRNSQRLQ